jgi:hypothetical protein
MGCMAQNGNKSREWHQIQKQRKTIGKLWLKPEEKCRFANRGLLGLIADFFHYSPYLKQNTQNYTQRSWSTNTVTTLMDKWGCRM